MKSNESACTVSYWTSVMTTATAYSVGSSCSLFVHFYILSLHISLRKRESWERARMMGNEGQISRRERRGERRHGRKCICSPTAHFPIRTHRICSISLHYGSDVSPGLWNTDITQSSPPSRLSLTSVAASSQWNDRNWRQRELSVPPARSAEKIALSSLYPFSRKSRWLSFLDAETEKVHFHHDSQTFDLCELKKISSGQPLEIWCLLTLFCQHMLLCVWRLVISSRPRRW